MAATYGAIKFKNNFDEIVAFFENKNNNDDKITRKIPHFDSIAIETEDNETVPFLNGTVSILNETVSLKNETVSNDFFSNEPQNTENRSNLTRKIPNFSMLNEKFADIFQVNKNRNKRNVGSVASSILPQIAKYAGWTIVWSTASAAGGATTAYVTDKLQQNRLEANSRTRQYDCHGNNFGPRPTSADWCFVEDPFKNETLTNGAGETAPSITKNFKPCRINSDCLACHTCSSDCFVEENVQLLRSN